MKTVAPDFEQIVERYYQDLYRFGLSLAKNEHEAADLVQQTYTIYAQKGNDLRDPSKVKSWLFTTLYREFLKTRRHGDTQVSKEPDALEADTPPVSPDVVDVLDAHSVMEALQALDSVYREPLTLFYLQDMSYREIATILQIPVGTVMSRISRGKAQLKEALLSRSSPN